VHSAIIHVILEAVHPDPWFARAVLVHSSGVVVGVAVKLRET
jgi:phenylpyruvate tautomerase PptA (4-oxalocrotonate tautomerase family)